MDSILLDRPQFCAMLHRFRQLAPRLAFEEAVTVGTQLDEETTTAIRTGCVPALGVPNVQLTAMSIPDFLSAGATSAPGPVRHSGLTSTAGTHARVHELHLGVLAYAEYGQQQLVPITETYQSCLTRLIDARTARDTAEQAGSTS